MLLLDGGHVYFDRVSINVMATVLLMLLHGDMTMLIMDGGHMYFDSVKISVMMTVLLMLLHTVLLHHRQPQ